MKKQIEWLISSATVKIFNKEDCFPIIKGCCLQNESFAFQVFLTAETASTMDILVESNVQAKAYLVKKMKGNYALNPKQDDFYLHPQDDMYPDLLQEVEKIQLLAGENATLFVEIPAEEKTVGEHLIKIKIGKEEICFPLTVMEGKLKETDLILTNWVHLDGICNYYKLSPFSVEFYKRFKQFLTAYVKMGNTMLFVPIFTPPLDTFVGGERLTTQLVIAQKVGDRYEFNFTQLKKYIELALSYGIKYFEFSHLFTQWGGKFCPKIIVEEEGEEKKLFGWDCASDDEQYLTFLKAFFAAFIPFLEEMGIKENSYLHLTDEPHEEHIEKYAKLSQFIRGIAQGVKLIDALSHYEYAEQDLVDLPAVCIQSPDLDKFSKRKKLLYYCVWIDEDCITNRYFHMPTIRTIMLGVQLYLQNADGFLHWGYNFYNTELSKQTVNPYEDTTAGGKFVAGDSFIVYPGEKDVEYSLRYFAMLQAFEDYRLLKTAEERIGRERVVQRLQTLGVQGVHTYPRDTAWYIAFKEELRNLICQ